MARRATKIQETRTASEHVLLLDAGNGIYASQGANRTAQGQYTIEGMNRLGYDAMTIGDLDFYWGVDIVKQRISEAEFPILSCNVYVGSADTLLAQAYVIKEMAGVRIAIIGVTSRNVTNVLANAGGEPLLVADPTAAVARTMQEVQGKADLVFVLSNLGFAEDCALAAAVPGISVIIGGRTGTILAQPFQDSSNKTIVTQAGVQGEWIGELQVSFDAQRNAVFFDGVAIVLNQDFADDPDMRAWLDSLPD